MGITNKDVLKTVAIDVPNLKTQMDEKVSKSELYISDFADGTNYIIAIKNAIKKLHEIGGGTLIFTKGEYLVEENSTETNDFENNFSAIFKLRSNEFIEFRDNAKIILKNSNNEIGVFGVDTDYLPIKNIGFKNVNIDTPIKNKYVGIMLSTKQNGENNSIENVKIDNCTFNNLASPVHIVHRSDSGGVERQVKNVSIKNCNATNCYWCFATVDGKDILIQNNKATGDLSQQNLSYDAVSVHSGINIKILNNTFSNFGVGQVINIRNSPENKCGSESIDVSNNTIYDCDTMAIQVSIQSGEKIYGVKNINISNNIIKNCKIGINVTAGSAEVNTPFNRVNIINNDINTYNHGLIVNNNSGLKLSNSSICNNNITTEGVSVISMQLVYIDNSKISSNKIYNVNNRVGSYTLLIEGINNSSITDNSFICDNTENETINIKKLYYSIFMCNLLKGTYSFSDISSHIKDNNTVNSGTVDGKNLGEKWSKIYDNTTFYSNYFPQALVWKKGDVCINNNPTKGGFEKWICVADGVATDQTWRGIGVIS